MWLLLSARHDTSDYIMYLALFSRNIAALLLASMKISVMSLMSVLTMCVLPLILALIEAGVSSYNREHQQIIINIITFTYLNGVTEGRGGANLSENPDSLLLYGESLRAGPDLDDLHHLLLAVGKGSDDQEPVQQVAGNAMGTADISTADSAVTCDNKNST